MMAFRIGCESFDLEMRDLLADDPSCEPPRASNLHSTEDSMIGTEQTIASLNAQLAEELGSIGKCLTHAERCAALGHTELSDRLEGFAANELRHAEDLIGMIVSLEGGSTIAKLTLIRTNLDGHSFENQIDDLPVTNTDAQDGRFALEIVRYQPVNWNFYEADEYATAPSKQRNPFRSSSKSNPRRSKRDDQQRAERQGEIMDGIEKNIHERMLVHASGKRVGAFIGTVAGLKKRGYIKLHKRDMPDGKRRYIPLEWVASITGEVVQLSLDAATVRREWLDKAMLKLLLKDDRRLNSAITKMGKGSQNHVASD
jgi:hypothetical protein